VDVTVIVGTYGEAEWYAAGYRAAKACREWHDVPAVHVHAATLADARNRGAQMARTEWLCFLDADDALGAGYFEAMATAAEPGRLLAPAVSYNGATPVTFQDRLIRHLNPCVIGTLIEADPSLAVAKTEEAPDPTAVAATALPPADTVPVRVGVGLVGAIIVFALMMVARSMNRQRA